MPSSFASTNSQVGQEQSLSDDWQAVQEHSSFGKPRNTGDRELGKSISISPTTVPIGKSIAHANQTYPPSSADGFDSGERAVRDMEHLRRNNQLLRHDSSDSEALTSISSSSFEFNAEMEASGTIVPDRGLEIAVCP